MELTCPGFERSQPNMRVMRMAIQRHTLRLQPLNPIEKQSVNYRGPRTAKRTDGRLEMITDAARSGTLRNTSPRIHA